MVEKTLKFHPRVIQMVLFGVCSGNSPSWDGDVEGFDVKVWVAAALRQLEEEVHRQLVPLEQHTYLEMQYSSYLDEWD